MYATVKTIYHTQLELLRALKEPFAPMAHSTLNEKFNIAANETLPVDTYPEFKWIAIGRGGHRGRITGDGLTVIDVLQHNITHAALYEHIPFIVREVNDDLTAVERDKYGMRTLVERDGVQYFAYYLMKMDYVNTFPVVNELLVENGEVTTTEYTAVPAQLNPTPIPYSNTIANDATGLHLSVASTLELSLDKTAIEEIINAVEVLYGDVSYAVISEVATVTGISSVYDTTLGGVNVSYNEVLAAQIANHIPTNIDLKFTTESINQQYSLGYTSPFIR